VFTPPDALHRSRVAATAAAVAAVSALSLAGCGGGSDQPAPPRTTTVTITPTPTTGATSPTTTPTTSASTTTAAAKPPSTYDEATALFATGVVDAAVQKVFTSPTGNIFCSIQTGGGVPAGCELRDGRVAAPADACPTGDAGAKDIGRIEWTDDTPKPICNSDSIYQVGAVVLQYGAIAAMPGSPFRCMSKEFGMTCVDTASKKGFLVARNTFVTF